MSESADAASKEPYEWVLPASIPFEDMKGKDLETCVYWLLDAMGAKDIEWRTGGTGGGAADGGRDIEAHFYTPADGSVEPEVWWIECKGRSGTVEKSQVQEAANNALAKANLTYLVIATNTQFSNPTIDWIKEWQAKFPRPKILLWDGAHLERLLSSHPDVVLRLYSEALSLDGQAKAVEARFWNRTEYSPPGSLEKLWGARNEIELSAAELFAVITNEFAHGDIGERPWAAVFDVKSVMQALYMGLINTPFLVHKSTRSGQDQAPIIRAIAYLIIRILDDLSAEDVASLTTAALFREDEMEMPTEVRSLLLLPIVDQVLSELQDVCSDDCSRILVSRKENRSSSNGETEAYWRRFDNKNEKVEADDRRLIIERFQSPCVVGFEVDEIKHCPLFGGEPTIDNVAEVFGIVKRVAAFRKAQASGGWH